MPKRKSEIDLHERAKKVCERAGVPIEMERGERVLRLVRQVADLGISGSSWGRVTAMLDARGLSLVRRDDLVRSVKKELQEEFDRLATEKTEFEDLFRRSYGPLLGPRPWVS